MRLKIALTSLLIFGFVLLLAWPWIVGRQPVYEHKAEVARYLLRFSAYVISLLVVFSSCAMLAVILARKQREAFREEALTNMKHLIEATLEDHKKKEGEQ